MIDFKQLINEERNLGKNPAALYKTAAFENIDKNLSVVQKIAFLLGENAAETESMLNSIIDSYGDDEEDR